MNQGDLYRWGRRVLADHGIDTASFDAMTLLCRCLQKDRQQILVHGEDLAFPEAETKYRAQIAKRAAREPLQYLLGDWEFLDMTLQVGPGVLVPREETELLCRQAAALLQPGGVGLDLCAGTGAVALGLQRLCPQKTVWAVEKYEQAFSFLCRNIQKWAPDHVKAVKADVLQGPIEGVWLYPVDFLLSNPPYVTPKAYEGLQEEVKKEPATALLGGEDGLLFYRVIAEKWVPLLKPGGVLAVEIGEEQAEPVGALFEQAGLCQVEVYRDFQELDRVITAKKRT